MEPLFSDLFSNSDKAAWIAQVQQELKSGLAYDSLRWQTGEGFTLDPYYTADSLNKLPLDVIQSAQRSTAGWLNTPGYTIDDPKTANPLLRDALTQGVDALVLTLPTAELNLSQLLNGIKLSDTPVFFRFSEASAKPQPSQTEFIQRLQTMAPYQLKGGLLTDIDKTTAEATRLTIDSPYFRTICISSHPFHNAGATATQELAFTLASLTDAYDVLTEAGLTLDQLVPKTMLSMSVGTSYFGEIAKLRALRVLVNRLLSYYSVAPAHSLFVHSQTSTFYDAAVAPYTNLLRATTEAMAAVLGGCDALTVHPYDAVLGKPPTSPDRVFVERIARNVSLLLKEESYLDKVADPASGSYYIEQLTYQLVEAAWALFLDVEKRGGLAKARDFVQQETDRAYQAKVEAVRNGNVLVGVTKFRTGDPTEQLTNVLIDRVNGWPNRRLASEFE